MSKKIVLTIIIILFTTLISKAQNGAAIKDGAPNIFVDCGYCDQNYIKEQIPIVNYVRDRKDADVHILFTSQKTGSGGNGYTLYFIGQNEYANIKDTVKYSTNGTDSEDMTRGKLVNALKLGLVKYISMSKVSDQMTISFKKPQQTNEPSITEDPWDNWLFRVSMNGNMNGEKNYKYLYLSTSVSANRTTEDLKLSFSLSNSYNQSKFIYDTDEGEESYLDISRSQYANASLIKAIDEHWSWGTWLSANSSTYNNIDIAFSFSPGIEYNVFPYSESNQRQLRIDYKISSIYHKYVEETYYFKKNDNLFEHNLDASLSLIKQWGSVSFGAEASNYLNDFQNFSYGFYASTSLKLFKGLSISLSGNYFKVGKQITLPLVGATLEEVLLRRRQLETSYNYFAYFSISYSFGSIFNNAVNPRFGGSGGSVMYFD